MKKIYIKPICETYQIESNDPLQASPNPKVDPNDDTDGMDAKGTNFVNFSDEED